MNEFEMTRVNRSIVDQKSRSQTMLRNTMSFSKFNARNEKGEFNSRIDNDLSELRRTKSDLMQTRKLIETNKYDTG